MDELLRRRQVMKKLWDDDNVTLSALYMRWTPTDGSAAYNGSDYVEPWVSYTMEGSGMSYNKVLHDYSKDYLTFNIISGGTIVWRAQNTAYTATIEYSTNSGETWTSITSNTGASAPSINVSAGDVVQFKGDNATYCSGYSRYNSFSGSTAKFEVEGNIMSLIDSTGFTTATTLASSYTFNQLFYYCAGLTSAENLVLPATTLVNNCYYQMFYGCTSLTTAPELPATTLANSCYFGMFASCTSLTTAPAELPATTLTTNCYYGMFYGCTNLNYIKAMFTTTPSTSYTRDWVRGVASSGTFVKNSAATWNVTGNYGVPTGWTVENAS